MERILLLFLFCCLSALSSAQSKVINEWKAGNKIESTYCFYPSTLRMVNVQRDPAFDKLVKPIRKMVFMNMSPDSIERKDLRIAANRMINEEQYETYAEVDGPDNALFVLGKEDKTYTCILAYNEAEYYMLEIEGMIDIMQLSKLYEKVSTQDSTSQLGMLNVLDLMNNKRAEKRERQERWKKRQKERATKDSIEQVKRDSLKALDPKPNEVIQDDDSRN